MTDDELVALLERSMRARDREAPTAESIRERVRSARPHAPSPRRRWWLPAIAAAACIVLLAGAVATWSASRDRSSPSPTASDHRRTQGPATRSVTVFLAKYHPNMKPDEAKWYLVPRQVTVPDSGDPGLDAVRALFEHAAPTGLVNWFHLRSQAVAKVNSVTLTHDRITVDIDRSLRDPYPGIDCRCPDAETVLQQLAWTVSTGLESQAPITLTVNRRPAQLVQGVRVLEGGRPNFLAIAKADRSFPWYRQACGRREIVAVIGDGRRIDIPPADNSLRPTAAVSLQIGDMLRFEIRGECFNPLSAATGGSSVLGTPDPNDRLTIVAQRPGTAVASVAGGACPATFTPSGCIGPYVLAAAVTVHVAPR
jgi:hypothetical protein